MLSIPTRKAGFYRHSSRRRTYRAVLLAVYWLADTEGIVCRATNAEIGRQAGLSGDTAKEYLHDLESEGTVAVYGQDNGLKHRLIVLLDHPDCGRFIDSLDMTNRLSRYELTQTEQTDLRA